MIRNRSCETKKFNSAYIIQYFNFPKFTKIEILWEFEIFFSLPFFYNAHIYICVYLLICFCEIHQKGVLNGYLEFDLG
jgi:hypothetical protein